jgi:membrane-bound ClpP family serine protease
LIDQGAAAAGVGDPKTFGGLLMVAIYFVIAFGTVVKGFAWAGMIAAFPIWLLGMYYGLLDVQLSLVMIVILVILFVREFWWKGG